MRAFIAIELPKEIKDTLVILQNQLKVPGLNAKWIEQKNIHLTLKFLGDINEEKFREITKMLDEIAKNHVAFKAKLSSLGVFPKIDFVRIIWVGISRGDQEIKAIAKEIEEETIKIGFQKENRAFSSHITIARVKSMLNKDKLAQALSNLNENLYLGQEFVITKVTLFKSMLSAQGPVYEVQKEANLKTI